MDVNQDCLDYAAAHPDVEVCGVIIDDAMLFPCRNIHPDPANQFRIDSLDWILAEEIGEITAIYHSHVGDLPVLSSSDRQQQVIHGLPWWLAQGGRLRKFRPVPHLLGRKFVHGVTDCYTMFRDAYHLAGVDLPDFERVNGWWMRHENLYLKNLESTGFHQVDFADAQPGDVIILNGQTGADPSHSMILLDENMVVHHDHSGFVSRREPYRLAYARMTHSIWRFNECSNLDLRGIYADFTAKFH